MKIQTKNYTESGITLKNSYGSKKNPQKISFGGNLPAKNSRMIDSILKSESAQWIFKLADKNPHNFNIVVMALIGVLLRPATILITPGAKKEDKQYAAGKSIIGSIIGPAIHVGPFIILANAINKLGKEAEKNPKIKFPKINTKEFEAFNYIVNNGTAFILSLLLALSVAKATAKIMNIVFPEKKEKNPGENIYNMKMSNSAERTFKDFLHKKEQEN